MYSANLVTRFLKYQSASLAQGSHTIKVVVRSDKNASSSGYNFFFDGFIVGNLVAVNNMLLSNYIVRVTDTLSALVGFKSFTITGLPTGYTAIGLIGARIATPDVSTTVWATGTTATTANAETVGSNVVVEVGAGELRGFVAGDTVYVDDGSDPEWAVIEGLTPATPSMMMDLDNNHDAGATITKYERSRLKLASIANVLYAYDGIPNTSVTLDMNILISKDNS